MKKWYGGILIVALSCILLVRYSYDGTKPPQQKKQSAYDFFRNHPSDNSQSRRISTAKASGINKEKPHYVDVDGLGELYSSVNISENELKSFAIWPQLRSLLSRSDALPETAKGVKEASVAWKDLLLIIKEDNTFSVSNNNTNATDSIKCPYSVSTFEKGVYKSGKPLELPCGLIEDSSITLIGIPNGKNRSFQIILEGAGSIHERKAPILLHYDVYLPEENSTKEPVIIQNTWTNEVGWGTEERCPKGRATNTIQVDGLASCNELFVRSTVEKGQNRSDPIADKQINNTVAQAHASSIFPFSEGSLFTATLWVGLEGFHMTVNGRHETSFRYRENLEPWLVDKVRVSGGVSIFSGIAEGLPVSEDLDLIAGIDQLKAPPLLLARRRLVLLVGVFSTANNFERRMALRRSWMQYEAVRSGKVAVRFIIGFHKTLEVNLDLWKEAQAYGDIQLMPFVDYYSLISFKTIAICILGTKIIPAKYIMKMDDDAFVRIDEVLSSLKEKPIDGLLYGRISFQSSPHRDTDSKWFVSIEEWPVDAYPPWAHGPGYIISRDIAKFIVRGHQERDLKLFKLEDVAMGIWIEEFKNSGRQVKYVTDDRFYNVGCDTDYILAHYQNPRKVLCLWEKLQKEHQAACCE